MLGSWVFWPVLDLLGCTLGLGKVRVASCQRPARTHGWAVYRLGGTLCPVQGGGDHGELGRLSCRVLEGRARGERFTAPTSWYHWEGAGWRFSRNEGQPPEELPVPNSTAASAVDLDHVLVIILMFYSCSCALPASRVWTNLVLYEHFVTNC